MVCDCRHYICMNGLLPTATGGGSSSGSAGVLALLVVISMLNTFSVGDSFFRVGKRVSTSVSDYSMAFISEEDISRQQHVVVVEPLRYARIGGRYPPELGAMTKVNRAAMMVVMALNCQKRVIISSLCAQRSVPNDLWQPVKASREGSVNGINSAFNALLSSRSVFTFCVFPV